MHGDFPPDPIDMARRMVALYGRIAGSRIYRVPALSAAVAAGATVVARPVTWRHKGTVIAIQGSTDLATAIAAANLHARIQFGASEDLITDGQAGADLPYACMFGGVQNWFPVARRVQDADTWTITYRNSGGAAVLPTMAFVLVEDGALCSFG